MDRRLWYSMKKKELISEKEWFERHKSDIKNINNIIKDLEQDKKIKKIYKKYIKLKSKNNRISYNTEEVSATKFESDTLLTSYVKREKIEKDNCKFVRDNSQMIFG